MKLNVFAVNFSFLTYDTGVKSRISIYILLYLYPKNNLEIFYPKDFDNILCHNADRSVSTLKIL